MEALQRLTRRQLEVLSIVAAEAPDGTEAPLARVATRLKVRPPSALQHLRALEAMRLIARRAGKSRPTPRGHRCLAEYRRHHRIAETLFSHLELPPEAACRAAREIDLALSHRTVERLCEAQGHPAVCPHGEPITPCRSPPVPGRR